MDRFLHLSKFEFTSKINDIAFKKSLDPNDVEKQYFFELIVNHIKMYAPNLLLNITFTNKAEGKFKIDGENQNIKQNYWDFFYMCNFLTTAFSKLKLNFHFVESKDNETSFFSCSLFYRGVFNEKENVVMFDLFPSSTNNEDFTEPDSSSQTTSSSSGGMSKELLKIQPKEIQNFINEQKTMSFETRQSYFKINNSAPILKTSSAQKYVQPRKANQVDVPLSKNTQTVSPISKIIFSKNLTTNTNVVKTVNVLKSIIKNNPSAAFSQKEIEKVTKLASKILPQSVDVKQIINTPIIKEECIKYNDRKYENLTTKLSSQTELENKEIPSKHFTKPEVSLDDKYKFDSLKQIVEAKTPNHKLNEDSKKQNKIKVM